MKRKSISLTLLAMLLTSIAAVLPISALPPDSMWIEPTTINGATVGYGNKFNVTVWMNVATLTNAWQAYVIYNKAHLTALRADYTGSGKSLWSGGFAVDTVTPGFGSHNATHDYVVHGEVLKTSVEKTGQGSLFWIEFQVIAAPNKYETLASIITADAKGTFDSFAQSATYVRCISSDPLAHLGTFGYATYTYAWTLPPTPHLAVSPQHTVYPKELPAVGKEFDIKVYIMGLSAEWNCHNVSFTLTYDDTLIEILSWTVDPLWTTNTVTDTPPTLSVFAGAPSSTPSGDVLVITVHFNVTYQGTYPDVDVSPLDLEDIVLYDTIDTIPTTAEVDGDVTIEGIITSPPAYFEIHDVTMGPDPCRGRLFNVTITLEDCYDTSYLIGYDLRLKWCIGSTKTLITPVAVYEGPFLPYFEGPLGTFWTNFYDDYDPYGYHLVVGNMIYPNATGRWNGPWPNSTITDNTVVIITFRVEYQSYGEPDLSCALEIIDQNIIGIRDPTAAEQEIIYLPGEDPINGTYTITTALPGRALDAYTQYPAPFGGQGFNQPSDMFWPQKEVELYANVTYNYWPVQQKDVAFEIRDPSGALWAVLVARTDVDGVARTSFRIPWPCDNPEDLFGVWTVTATVDIACIVITDILEFHFDYLVSIFKVTTDKFEYDHCDEVCVTIEYGTHAQQEYPLVLMVVIKDELNVPIGVAYIETTIGGAVFCQYKEYTDVICIHIDKFAFAGIATVHVTAYNALPSMGGSAYGPEYTPIPEIAIQPY